MKITILTCLLLSMPLSTFAQTKEKNKMELAFINHSPQLTQDGAFELVSRVRAAASKIEKIVTIAILDSSGQVIILTKGDGVGPHNTEAARRKAYTALSTKTSTLVMSRNARSNPDTQNLANLPELLLLSGGQPLWQNGKLIGSIGVAGGGSPENDDNLAKAAIISEIGISTQK